VGPVPLPRRALGLGHVHARLLVPPVARGQGHRDGPSILRYIRAAAHQHGVDRRVRYHRRVVRAAWSSSDARWTVEVENAESGELERLTCRFLYGNTGYYRYDEGYSPRFEGASDFGGRIVHPQHWPADLEWEDRSVVVIGSGATAVTLVPALAARASHVTMLQRSPSYVMSLPEHDGIADLLRHLLPERLAYPLVRWKNVVLTTFVYQLCRRAPRLMARLLKKGVASQLPADFDVETHFSPRYSPWDQRLCFVPDGDLFKALSSGRASVVTGQIERLTGDGVLLDSGATLDADIIVSATGLNMQMLGGMAITVDGRPSTSPSRWPTRASCCAVFPISPSRSVTPTRRGRSRRTSPPATSAGSSTTWTSAVPARAGPSHPIRRSRGSR